MRGVVAQAAILGRKCRRFFDPLLGHMVVCAPSVPSRPCPFANPANVLIGLPCLVDVDDRESSTLARIGMTGPPERLWSIQPSLHGPIHLRAVTVFERAVHPRKVRRIGLRRPHVFHGMLKGVGIHHQAMLAGVPVVAELTRQEFVEHLLATCAAIPCRRSALRAVLRSHRPPQPKAPVRFLREPHAAAEPSRRPRWS